MKTVLFKKAVWFWLKSLSIVMKASLIENKETDEGKAKK